MALRVKFHVAHHRGPAVGSAVDRHEPALRYPIEGRIARVSHVSDVIEQIVSHSAHGVHTRTRRYPAVAHADRKSSSLTRRSGPSAGSWNVTSSFANSNAAKMVRGTCFKAS